MVQFIPSVQISMRAGHMPQPEDNGQRYLRITVNALLALIVSAG